MSAHNNLSRSKSAKFMQTLWAEQALTSNGWQKAVRIEIDPTGHIISLKPNTNPASQKFKILLPAPVNLHSHSFQRAMAGMTEWRGADKHDTFWTWRALMYRFLDQLTPNDIESIAAFVQMEMLEAGYATVCEFHYIHHQPDGHEYDDIAELAQRIAAAANQTGIGLTLLPVFYQYGGCDLRPLGPGQVRFGNNQSAFLRLFEGAKSTLKHLPDDCTIGVAPHSLRAVSRTDLEFASQIAPTSPLHMHIAEQTGEIEEVQAHWEKRPMQWLLDNHAVDEHWCLIHATHMHQEETVGLARSGAVAGLCPITESNLGDGIFDGARYLENGGKFGIGSDSNIRISLSGELRMLEYSQRLRDRGRAILASQQLSAGRTLFAGAVKGSAQAAGRNSGMLAEGKLADIIALNGNATDLINKQGDAILDTFIFAGDDRMVTNVWSAGRHLVSNGQCRQREAIIQRYQKTVSSLQGRI